MNDFFLLSPGVPGVEPQASCMLDEHSATELQHQFWTEGYKRGKEVYKESKQGIPGTKSN